MHHKENKDKVKGQGTSHSRYAYCLLKLWFVTSDQQCTKRSHIMYQQTIVVWLWSSFNQSINQSIKQHHSIFFW